MSRTPAISIWRAEDRLSWNSGRTHSRMPFFEIPDGYDGLQLGLKRARRYAPAERTQFAADAKPNRGIGRPRRSGECRLPEWSSPGLCEVGQALVTAAAGTRRCHPQTQPQVATSRPQKTPIAKAKGKERCGVKGSARVEEAHNSPYL